MDKNFALTDLLVVEIGEREGAGACATLLAQLGADVVLVEPVQPSSHWKWRNRPPMAAGKRSILAGDDEMRGALLARADIIVLSSDVTHLPAWRRGDRQIVCDITAFGNTGPLQGLAYTDAMVQAIAGLADTTGDPGGPPVLIGLPFLEFSAGTYAASAIVAALRVRGISGLGQDIDIALFDCAVSALATFLPFPVSGKEVTRAGNKHALASPWNAYRALDGWVLVCTATDDQWARLCGTIGRPQLIDMAGFATNPQRVANARDVDTVVEQWTLHRSVQECIKSLAATGIACGPILTVAQMHTHENLLYRRMIVHAHDEATDSQVTLPGSPLKASITAGRIAGRISAPGADRSSILETLASGTPEMHHEKSAHPAAAPYKGLRVVEIGQYTTAPLVSRQLAAMGAEVIKLEPAAGDGSRNWPPHQGDQGYFFTFSNSDKRSVVLDLASARDKLRFRALLETADVLVENLKPGALARLGFDAAELQRINGQLVYCSISGFGRESVFPGRPAFDTVVQAMCGFMDLTRAAGTPMKSGISAADIIGGELALLAVVSAIEYRDRCGTGQDIDISMQDAGVWATQMEWHSAPALERTSIVQCSDGFLGVSGETALLDGWLDRLGIGNVPAAPSTYLRERLSSSARETGLMATPVNNVSEVLNHPQTVARNLVLYVKGADGVIWPLLNSPLRMSRTPPVVGQPIGKLGEGNSEILGPLDAAIEQREIT